MRKAFICLIGLIFILGCSKKVYHMDSLSWEEHDYLFRRERTIYQMIGVEKAEVIIDEKIGVADTVVVSIYGKVIDKQNSYPIANALLELVKESSEGNEIIKGYTNEKGEFELNVFSGEYFLNVSFYHFYKPLEKYEINFESGEIRKLEVVMDKPKFEVEDKDNMLRITPPVTRTIKY